MSKKRLVIGISGASGSPLAIHMLKILRELPDWETHVIATRGGIITLKEESGLSIEQLKKFADFFYDAENIGATIASGSFNTEGMIIVPCSMKTAAGIHSGYADNLLLRAADVTLKERRKLVLLTRETPFSSIHLRNLYELSLMGVTILPPMMTYYNKPSSIEHITHHIVCKALNLWGLEIRDFQRWQGISDIL